MLKQLMRRPLKTIRKKCSAQAENEEIKQRNAIAKTDYEAKLKTNMKQILPNIRKGVG